MGPTTYLLCQKPVIGLVMWAATLCAFPPLFSDAPIELAVAGATVTRSFTVPVEKGYPLALNFRFPSVEARLGDQIVGDRHDEKCNGKARYEEIPEIQRSGLGRPIPLKVVVRKTADRSVVVEQTFESLCITSHNGTNAKTRTIGWLTLPIGDYIAEITNLQAQPGFSGVVTTVSLYGGQGK
ncbi:MAG TPA: DUF5625 family protein [Noviherbaspirillum sp.]|nr:DUF5625 family protein [Noviherbaspirillum sp.]